MEFCLKENEIDFMIDSLYYTKRKFEEYPIGKNGYPSYQFKTERIKEVNNILKKLKKQKRRKDEPK